jgi:hypothetical protein
VEASHLLDLKKLMGDVPPNLLLPLSKKDKSIFQRSPDRYYLVLVISSTLLLFIRWLRDLNSIVALFTLLIILGISIQKNRIKETYYVSDDGLIVPYTWISNKRIKLENIVEINNEKLIEKETSQEYDGIRIKLDHSGLKFNTTGITEPNIVLSSEKFYKSDLDQFAEEVRKYKRDSSGVTNTLAQRLTDQVNRSWNGRWKLIIFNVLDSSSEFGFILLLIYIVMSELVDVGLSVFLIIYLLYIIGVLGFNILDRPSAIVGIRSHELGALVYNEADLLTTVRFIFMGMPDKIKLLNCELLFEGDPISQVNELRELHPEVIEAGSLTYCVAQFVGNQTKSIGANIQFCYLADPDQSYQLPVYWA